jgi:hypothetical protein
VNAEDEAPCPSLDEDNKAYYPSLEEDDKAHYPSLDEEDKAPCPLSPCLQQNLNGTLPQRNVSNKHTRT